MSFVKNALLFFGIVALIVIFSEPDQPTGSGSVEASQKNRTPWPFLNEAGGSEVGKELDQSNIYVVFDNSGSMIDQGCSGNQTKSDAAKNALQRFARDIPTATNLGLLVFDNYGISERLSLGLNNRNEFIKAVNQSKPGSGTPLKSSISIAYKKLTEQGRRQLGYGNYHLVVVTDGEASSGESPKQVVNDILKDSPIVFHTIGFCIRDNHSLNQAGKIIYKSAMNVKELQEGLKGVLAESEDFVLTDFKQGKP
ncbi:MAG: VWA domain-containing protein [Gammaproteobacteria bacterium]|nr:VWA domain-containing protein [Gammaproteobacteria bacterium]